MLTVSEVSEILHIARSFVYRIMDSNDPDGRPILMSVKIGNKARRIPREALEAYIDRLKSEQRAS
jgi:excisionase family DNA binding protein